MAAEIDALMFKYLQNELSMEEKQLLEQWLNSGTANRAMFQQWTDAAAMENKLQVIAGFDKEKGWKAMKNAGIVSTDKSIRKMLWRWVAAAAIIFAIGSGIYYFNTQFYQSQKSSQITLQTTGITPGTDKAIWILADGKQIELDSTILDMTLKKTIPGNFGYNELRTPRGGQYQLILPDGSKVWLNAASSIKYPVVFGGKERRVDVTGEAYFEVVKDVRKPFKVNSKDQEIEVLGTSFNINAYEDETFKTSLAEGAVKINQFILKPGQAYINGKVTATNIEQDLAWKSGFFSFNNADLYTVMRQLARWYDIEVQYKNNLSPFTFRGEIDRTLELQEVLKILTDAEVPFKLQGRTLIIGS